MNQTSLRLQKEGGINMSDKKYIYTIKVEGLEDTFVFRDIERMFEFIRLTLPKKATIEIKEE